MALYPEKVAYWYFRLNGFLQDNADIVCVRADRGLLCTRLLPQSVSDLSPETSGWA